MNTHHLPSNPGVYAIADEVTGKEYVGSSYNVRKRAREHSSALRRGVHHNRKLQRAWTRRSDAFSVRLIEQCEVDVLLVREQHWIDELRPWYNICQFAGATRGVRLSAARRDALRQLAEGRCRDNPAAHAAVTEKANNATRENWARADFRAHMAVKMGEVAVRLRKYVTFEGITDSIDGWAQRVGVNPRTMKTRLQRWSVEEALTTPASTRGVSMARVRAKRKGQLYVFGGRECTVSEIAAELGVSRPGLRWYIDRHGLPAAIEHYRSKKG